MKIKTCGEDRLRLRLGQTKEGLLLFSRSKDSLKTYDEHRLSWEWGQTMKEVHTELNI